MDQLTKEEAVKAVQWIETSGSAHTNLKEAWISFKDKDPVDAVKDAELLFRVLEARIRY